MRYNYLLFKLKCLFFNNDLLYINVQPSLTAVTIDKTVTSRKVIEVSVPDVELSNINEAIQLENYLSGKLAIEEMKDLTKNIMQSKREVWYLSSIPFEKLWFCMFCLFLHVIKTLGNNVYLLLYDINIRSYCLPVIVPANFIFLSLKCLGCN